MLNINRDKYIKVEEIYSRTFDKSDRVYNINQNLQLLLLIEKDILKRLKASMQRQKRDSIEQ